MKIIVIGAGQLGSRHLQALKNVKFELEIFVVDPSNESLKVSKERFDSVPDTEIKQKIHYLNEIPDGQNIDIAIIATSSNVRRITVENLLNKCSVKFIILEKLLFSKVEDYQFIDNMLQKFGVKAWVNCSMRAMPFYSLLKTWITDEKIDYHVTGSNFGLITNSIHYIDHISYLSNCKKFTVDTSYLLPVILESKRKDFLELNGNLIVNFENGSQGVFKSHSLGNSPGIVEIFNSELKIISIETEGRALVSKVSDAWKWQEFEARIPYQSEMTTRLVNELIEKGSCPLVSFKESCELHLPLHNALINYLNAVSKSKYDYLPFT